MIHRRTFLGCGSLAVTGLLLDDRSLYSARGAVSPIVATTAGKVRGITAGILTAKSVALSPRFAPAPE